MAKKTWIEVAVNGASTRNVQPRIPVLAKEIIAEGVACIKAGAAVIHAHTLEPDSGRQNGNIDNCAAFINGIREQVDAIVYPTVVGTPDRSNPAWLWEPTVELVKRGLLEWGFLDPGSVNLCFIDSEGARYMGGDGVYINTNPALWRSVRDWQPSTSTIRPTPVMKPGSYAMERCSIAAIRRCRCRSTGSCSRPG